MSSEKDEPRSAAQWREWWARHYAAHPEDEHHYDHVEQAMDVLLALGWEIGERPKTWRGPEFYIRRVDASSGQPMTEGGFLPVGSNPAETLENLLRGYKTE